MTGILPLQTSGVSSNLKGVFEEYSITAFKTMTEYVGFTNEEVKHLCKIYLEDESNNEKNHINYDDIKKITILKIIGIYPNFLRNFPIK